jgi:hypothetical protein
VLIRLDRLQQARPATAIPAATLKLALLGASANSVLKRHRYPRALFTPQTTPVNRDVDPGERCAAAGAVPVGTPS